MEDGTVPVADFIRSLDKPMHTKALHTLELLKEYGHSFRPPYSKELDDNTNQRRKQHFSDSLLLCGREHCDTDERFHQKNLENTARRNRTGKELSGRLQKEESIMLTFEEFKAESLKDPEMRREYEKQAEEFRRISEAIRAEIYAEEEEHRRASMPPSHPAFA